MPIFTLLKNIYSSFLPTLLNKENGFCGEESFEIEEFFNSLSELLQQCLKVCRTESKWKQEMFESGIMEQVLETYFGGDNEFKRYDKGIQIMEHIAQVDPDATLKRMKMYGEQVTADSSKVCPLVYTIEFVKRVFNKYGGLFF